MAIKKPDTNLKSSQNNENENEEVTTKKVEVDLNSQDEPDTMQMEFSDDEEMANSHVTQQTKVSKDDSLIDDNTPADQVRKDVEEYEKNKSGTLEYKDLKQMAEFIITLIDSSLSTVFRLIAKDTSSSAYAIEASNKRILVTQLAMILSKYQSKFKIEFMFFIGIVMLYAPPAIAAFNNRKKQNKAIKEEKEKKIKLPGTPHYSKQVAEELIKQEIEKEKPEEIKEKKEKEKILDNINVGVKRKKGTQPKAY